MVHLEEILKHQRKSVSKMLKLTQQWGHQATREVGEQRGRGRYTPVHICPWGSAAPPRNSNSQEMPHLVARLVVLCHSGLNVYTQGRQLQTCLMGSR